MPNIDKYPAGAFVWVELGTTDQAAAKNFYASLFGWKANDMPMGPGEYYTIFRLEGRDTAAAYTLHPDLRAARRRTGCFTFPSSAPTTRRPAPRKWEERCSRRPSMSSMRDAWP